MSDLIVQPFILASVPSLTLCIVSVVAFEAFIQEGNGHLVPIKPDLNGVYKLTTPEMVGDMSLIIKTADGLMLRINRNVPRYVKIQDAINIQFSHSAEFGVEEVLRDGKPVTWHAQQLSEGSEYTTELAMRPGQSVRAANREFEQTVRVQ